MSNILMQTPETRQNLSKTSSRFSMNFEKLFVVTAIFFLSGAVGNMLIRSSVAQDAAAGSPELRLLYALIYAIAGVLLLRCGRRALDAFVANWPFLAITALAIASALWSIEPAVTLQRSIALVGTIGFGFYLVTRFSFYETLRLMAHAFAAAAWLSLLFAIFLPQLGRMETIAPGAWQGVFIHKNLLGVIMVWSVAINIAILFNPTRRSWINIVNIFIALYLIVEAQSATSLLTVILICFGLVVARIIMLRSLASISIILFIVSALIILVPIFLGQQEYIFSLLGRDPTLTGRADLWRVIWSIIQGRFWFGFGYGAFWSQLISPGGVVESAVRWQPFHSHNGWLQLWLNSGLVGVLIIAFAYLRTLTGVMFGSRQHGAFKTYAMMLLSLVIFVVNVDEAFLIEPNSINTIIFLVCAYHAVAKNTACADAVVV